MFRSVKRIFLTTLLVLSVSSCFINTKKELPTVVIGPPVYYENDSGERFEAKYGSLSDGTLHFVKLKMPDGKEYTLHQAVSGSGARYTDDKTIVWWEHQGTARVDVRGANGQWETRYADLREINAKK